MTSSRNMAGSDRDWTERARHGGPTCGAVTSETAQRSFCSCFRAQLASRRRRGCGHRKRVNMDSPACSSALARLARRLSGLREA